jgi:hypothetical protein
MSELSSVTSEPADPPRRNRWVYIVLFLVLPICVLIGVYESLSNSGNSELRQAIAEADRLDPRWRLEDVETDRLDVPPERNSAEVVMVIKTLMPPKWPAWGLPLPTDPAAEAKRMALEESFQKLEPQRQLNAEQMDALRTELKKAAAALAEARRLSDMPDGRYPIEYKLDFISTLLPYAQTARETARMLSLEVLLQAQEGKTDEALTSCRAILNAGRSFGDEPVLISQLVRIACRAIAVGHMQRTLAQGKPADAALRQVQQLMEKEEPEPLLLIGLRGERGGFDRFLAAIQSGQLKLSGKELAALSGSTSSASDHSWQMASLSVYLPGFISSQRAALLRHMTRAIEIAKLPPNQQAHEMEQLDANTKQQAVLVRLLAPALSKVANGCLRSRVELRCAIAALAAERYRRDKGRWPDSLEALRASDYLTQVPVDLYDGKPLRFRRLDDGLLIYSVGPDGADNGGFIDREKLYAPGTDMGFRLWDVSRRRQPPAPPKPPPDQGGAMPPGFPPPPGPPPAGNGK